MTDWKNLLQYEESFFQKDVSFLIIGSGTRNQLVLKELLLAWNATCEMANDLESGIRCLKSKTFDMIFIDEKYQTETSIFLKEQYEQGIPIVILAGRLQRDKAATHERKSACLIYPITALNVQEILRSHFSKRMLRRSVARHAYEVAELFLIPHGIDLTKAMKFVADDFEQYIHLLKRFTDEEERHLLLEEAYVSKNWGNYVTYVHALKNSARLIGAEELADMAYKQELQLIAGQYEAIEQTYRTLILKWANDVACVKDYLEHCVSEYDKGEVQIASVLSEDVFRYKVEQVKEYLNTFQKKEALMLLKQLSAYRTDENRLKMIEQAIIALERYDYDGVMQILAGEL